MENERDEDLDNADMVFLEDDTVNNNPENDLDFAREEVSMRFYILIERI